MNDPTRQSVKELLDLALEQTGAERAALLDRECSDDTELRKEVEELIRALESRNGFLETPALELDVEDIARWANPDAVLVGKQVGRYMLERVIASGGMGTVYEGRKGDSDEIFAIKMMRPGLVSESAQRRFVHEAGVLSRLDHVGIARIYDVGSHDTGLGDVPFFAMEYVQGALPLTEYATAQNLNTRSKLDLFLQICQAVEHGHQKGIVHRDLKPANILVDADGAVKVIDFGVARVTDDDLAVTTLHTQAGQLIGTLAYMSPEQCAGDPDDIDTRSDVYSLGVVLFDLLTGSLPHDLRGLSVPDAIQIVREQEPTRASSHNQTLSGDLDTILLKALEKDRDRRYGSVSELNQDIQRHLNHEPILARPPSNIYRIGKFARRNKALVAVSVTASVALIAAFVALIDFAASESRALTRAEDALDESERQTLIAEAVTSFLTEDVLGVFRLHKLNHDVTMREVLDVAAADVGTKFADDPLQEVYVRLAIARSYRYLGLYDKVEEQLIVAIQLSKDLPGFDEFDRLVQLNELGLLRAGQGRVEEALVVYREAHEGFLRTEGPDSDWTLTLQTNIGNCLGMLGRRSEAEEMYRELVEATRRVFGENSIQTLKSQMGLAAQLNGQGKRAEARAIYESILPVMIEVLGEDNDNTLGTMHQLAVLDSKDGLSEQAAASFAKIIVLRTRTQGPEHPFTLLARHNYAAQLYRMGQYEEANRHFVEIIEIFDRTLGFDHPSTLASRFSYAAQLAKMGHYEEAKRRYSEIIEISDRTLGIDHPQSLMKKVLLSFSLAKLGEYEEAVELARWVATRAESASGVTDVAKIRYSHDLAWRLRDAGRSNEAIPIEESNLVKRKEILGPEHLDTFHAAVLLARLYDDVEQFEEAAQHLQWAEEVSRRVHGIDHVQYGRVLNAFGDHFVLIQSFEEGEQNLLRAHSIYKDARGVRYNFVVDVIVSIIRLYEAWDKPEQAEAWRARLYETQARDK